MLLPRPQRVSCAIFWIATLADGGVPAAGALAEVRASRLSGTLAAADAAAGTPAAFCCGPSGFRLREAGEEIATAATEAAAPIASEGSAEEGGEEGGAGADAAATTGVEGGAGASACGSPFSSSIGTVSSFVVDC